MGECLEEDIIDYLSSRVFKYMIPKYIEIRDVLPMNQNGKIYRKELVKND